MVLDIKLLKSDLPFKSRKPILQAVIILWKKLAQASSGDKRPKNTRHSDFARALKDSLDNNLGAHWHVLVGGSIGFACKKRDRCMGLFKVSDGGDNLSVVIWQSPGIEELDADQPEVAAPGAAASKAAVKILELGKGEAGEPDSELQRVVATVKAELAARGDEDTQGLAVQLRRRLTAEFGTIWHVVAGLDFVLEAAWDRRNYVVATVGKVRVVCFQHEQSKGGVVVDFSKMVSTLPYLFLMIMCFGFMTLNSVCKAENVAAHEGVKASIRDTFCHTDWETYLQYVGGAAIVSLLFSKYQRRREANKEAEIKIEPKKQS